MTPSPHRDPDSRVRELIAAHYEGLYRYAFRLSGNASDAEDCTQETFRKAIPRLDQIREPEHTKAWLYRILRNTYLVRVRDDRRARITPVAELGDLPCDDPPSFSNLDAADLQAALTELDESFRTPLILFYFNDLSYREIAEQMGLPMGTVMSRLARGKAYLRTQLDGKADPASVADRDGER